MSSDGQGSGARHSGLASAVRSGLSFCCSSLAMRVCLCCRVRRLTWVGCAVSTISTDWSQTALNRSSFSTPWVISCESTSSTVRDEVPWRAMRML